MERKITMKDIARMAGVDRSSVSRILNQSFERHSYRPETVKRVMQLAREHGFRPNRTARALKTGRTQLIGLLMSDLRNPFFGELAARMDEAFSEMGCRVVIADSGNRFGRETQCLRDLLGFNVDGIIFSPCGLKRQPLLKTFRRPVVVLDYDIYPDRPSVVLDERNVAEQLVGLARRKGYRRIGLVCHHETRHREDAFRALAGDGLVVLRPPETLRRIRRIDNQVAWNRERNADALIGMNNETTLRMLESLHADGVAVPEEIGVAGIDDFPLAGLLTPALTVVRQPIEDYARKAVEYLRAKINDPDCRLGNFYGAAELIERGSL